MEYETVISGAGARVQYLTGMKAKNTGRGKDLKRLDYSAVSKRQDECTIYARLMRGSIDSNVDRPSASNRFPTQPG